MGWWKLKTLSQVKDETYMLKLAESDRKNMGHDDFGAALSS